MIILKELIFILAPSSVPISAFSVIPNFLIDITPKFYAFISLPFSNLASSAPRVLQDTFSFLISISLIPRATVVASFLFISSALI